MAVVMMPLAEMFIVEAPVDNNIPLHPV